MSSILCPHCKEEIKPDVVSQVQVIENFDPETSMGEYHIDWADTSRERKSDVFCSSCGTRITEPLRTQLLSLMADVFDWKEVY